MNPPARRRRLAERAAALALGLVCALGLLEVGLRVFGHGMRERAERVFDPRYGEVRRDSWIFGFRIDPARHRAVDLRGQLVPLEKPAGETRVLFLGDSATEGAFVPLEASYPCVWERLLDERRPEHRVRAINAGVWGMTPIDEYHLLRDKLLPLAPDRVVVGLFMANDINFNLAHVERRRAPRRAGWVDAARERSALADALFLGALALAERHPALAAASTGPRSVPVEVGLVDENGLHMLSYPSGELATYVRRPSPVVDHAFEVLGEVLRSFHLLAEEHGFELQVLLIPSPSRVLGRLAILAHPDILLELRERGVHLSRGDLDVGLPTRRVLAICKELGVRCIDPTPRLQRLGTSAFFPRDEHPSAAGHRALAEALFDAG